MQKDISRFHFVLLHIRLIKWINIKKMAKIHDLHDLPLHKCSERLRRNIMKHYFHKRPLTLSIRDLDSVHNRIHDLLRRSPLDMFDEPGKLNIVRYADKRIRQ